MRVRVPPGVPIIKGEFGMSKLNHFHASISDGESKVSYPWGTLYRIAMSDGLPRYKGEAGKSILSNRPGLRYTTKEIDVILTKDEIRKLVLENLSFLEVDFLKDYLGDFYEISNIDSYIEPNVNIVI